MAMASFAGHIIYFGTRAYVVSEMLTIAYIFADMLTFVTNRKAAIS